VSQGRNMVIMGEPKRRDILNPYLEKLGIQMMKGTLVQPVTNVRSDIIAGKITNESENVCNKIFSLTKRGYSIAMPGAAGLSYTVDKGFKVTPLITTNGKNSWNELETIDFDENRPSLNEKAGEKIAKYPICLALTRKVNDKEQRIMIFGDTDFLSNSELSKRRTRINAANFSFMQGMSKWFSFGEFPIEMSRPYPPDNKIFFNYVNMKYLYLLFKGLIPLIIMALGLFICLKRKNQ